MPDPDTCHRATAPLLTVLLCGLLGPAGAAWAQEPEAAGEEAAGEEAAGDGAAPPAAEGAEGAAGVLIGSPPPAPPPPVDWAEDHAWIDLGFRGEALALALTTSGELLAMDRYGTVHRRTAAGRWVRDRSLTADPIDEEDAIDDEDLLLDVEATIEELQDGGGGDAVEDETEAALDEGIGDAIDSSIQLSEQFLAPDLASGSTHILWTDAFAPGLVIAGFGGQSWRSTDDGETWEELETLTDATEIVRLRPGEDHLVAATRRGLRHSLDDGRSWITVDDALGDIAVHGVASVGGEVFAGTSVGLFVSADGLRWTRLYPPDLADQPVTAVARDPWWDDGLWVAAEQGLYRTDDRGETFRWAGRNPLAGTRMIVTLGRTGHILVGGDDGVWESSDGGVRWQPLPTGLSGPMVHDLLAAPDGRVWLAGEGGVHRLDRQSAVQPTDDGASELAEERLPEVGLVLDWTMGRAGVDHQALAVQGSIVRSLLSPRLRLTGRLYVDDNLATDFGAIESTRTKETRWVALADLCFGGCGGTQGTTDVAFDAASAIDSGDLTVIGGQVYEADSTEAMASAGANVSERMSKYRTSLATTVTELYFSRVELVAQQSELSALSLEERVGRRLDIDEVTARLDVFTDGSFSRYIAGGREPVD